MASLQNLYNTMALNPPFTNGTAVRAIRSWASNISYECLFDYIAVVFFAAIIFTILVVAIVIKTKTHKRRERRWRRATYQERKCSACRGRCEHPGFIGLVR